MEGLVLGIESSCDECAAAVVRHGSDVLSSVVHSQITEHAPYGGVVPEIASRSHLRTIIPAIDQALREAHVDLGDIELVSVTNQPGLIGSLLIGLSAGKGLALARGIPFVAVHHIQAHVYSAALEADRIELPCLALVVSGGHTALYSVRSFTDMKQVGRTLDDAVGECFDKVASLLGLAYPGGPAIAALATRGNPTAFDFPRYRPKDDRPGFSFSGLKTAVLYHLRGQNALAPTPQPDQIPRKADIAASFQEAAVDALVQQTLAAARALGSNTVLVTGGVACNRRLRERMHAAARSQGVRDIFPSPAYCTDNAAMVAGLGWHLYRAGKVAGLEVDASPS